MGKRDFRYRRWRDDRFGHAKTGGMRPTSYFLEDLAAAQNILGVLQHSPRAIAERFGRVPVKQITDAIAELVDRGSARWWPELETLWVVEVLDEQSDGPKVDVHAAKLLPTLALPVQAAIRERYGARVEPPPQTPPDTPSDRVPEGVCPSGSRKQEAGTGEQEQPPTPASGGARRPRRSEPTPRTASLLPDEPTASTDAESPIDAATTRVLAHLNAELARLGEPGKFRDRQFIRARIAGGATEDEARLVIDARVDECRRKPDAIRHLNPKTPFRPGNWETALAHARAWRRTSRPSGPRLDVGPDELERRRAEADEWDAKRREGVGS